MVRRRLGRGLRLRRREEQAAPGSAADDSSATAALGRGYDSSATAALAVSDWSERCSSPSGSGERACVATTSDSSPTSESTDAAAAPPVSPLLCASRAPPACGAGARTCE
eukprot:scaffold120056_cov60-Phaeocystis_antarctica.AAC.1